MTKIINTNTADNIKKRGTEDLPLLKSLNKILTDKKGYAVKMPTAGTPVLACISGGLDSVSNLAVLMERFKLKVYPFFLKREQTNFKYENESVDFFNAYYKKRYPKLFNDILKISINTPAKEYKEMARATKAMNSITKESVCCENKVAYPVRNSIIFLTGMEYGYSLQSKMKDYPKTIFAVFSNNNNDELYHSSLTFVRTMNLLMCQITNDYKWQFISIPIETEFGNYYDKDIFVKFVSEIGIPLEKSRSCVKNTKNHCGKCNSCLERQKAFKKAGVEDKTIYEN